MREFDSVLALNNHLSNLINDDYDLSSLSVRGELSGVKIYEKRGRNGQLYYTVYFTLKDESAVVGGIMFLNSRNQLGFQLENGQEVVCYGSGSIYEPKGEFRIKATTMALQGKGSIQEQMNRMYQKLNSEGLFNPEHKLRIPLLPRRIGVITSRDGDVIHDILDTLNKHNSHYDILIYPAASSGQDCPYEIIQGINYFCKNKNVDVIIIARGGGAPEEFVGYNSEELARTIYDATIPIISAVGHQPVYTICDFVSDIRVPTPTAAGSVCIGGYVQLTNDLENKKSLLRTNFDSYIRRQRIAFNSLRRQADLLSPEHYIQTQKLNLTNLNKRLLDNGQLYLAQKKNQLSNQRQLLKTSFDKCYQGKINDFTSLIDKLSMLGPINVLKRGYSYVTLDDYAVTSVKNVSVGNEVNIVFADGSAEARIISVNEEQNNE